MDGRPERNPVGVQVAQEAFVAALLATERYADPRRLARYEHQVFSQNGEDGILAEIFRRIGTRDRTFVEIGAGDGMENNTAFLLLQGWRGVWVEGDPTAAAAVRRHLARPLTEGRLRLVERIVQIDNVAAALREAGAEDALDLLSLDVDRTTYWIWAALPHLRPRAVVVEYNALFPPEVEWVVSADGPTGWNGTACFGASLKAYERLGERLGYRLVGCDLTGINAFFVRQDLCGDQLLAPFDAATHYEPARYWLVRRHGHPRSYGFFAG